MKQKKQLKTDSYDGIKAGVWYTFGNILIKAIPFLSLPIFTRLMTTNDFGVYNTYLSYENILGVVLGFGISQSVKVAKYDFKEMFETFMSSVLKTVALAGLFFLIIANLFFFSFDIKETFFNWLSPLILNLLILNSVSTALYGIMGYKYVIQGRYKENLFISMIMTLLNVGSSLFLCYFYLYDNRALARIAGTAIGAVSVAVFILAEQSKKAKLVIIPRINKYAFKYGLPLIPHQLSISLFSQCDKIMIQAMIGNNEAGIYGLAVNIMLVLSVIVNSFDNAWTPWFFENLKEKAYDDLYEKNNIFVIFFAYIYCGFILICPDLIKIFSDKPYWFAVYALIPLAVSSYINFIYLFSVGVEYFYKKTGVISIATLTCTGANLVLNYYFIIHFGYVSAAYSTCITKFLLFSIHYFVSKKILKENIVGNKYILSGLTIVVIIAFISYMLVDQIIARLIIILIITFFAYAYFKNIGLIDKMKARYIIKK